MITKFTVSNYLSFKDKQTIILATQKQTKTIAIYGANASGKSNLIKSFAFASNLIINGLKQLNDIIPVEPFLLDTKTENMSSLFEFEIKIKNEVFIYGFEITKNEVCKEWLYQYPNKKTLFKREKQNIKVNARYFKEGSANTKKQTRNSVLYLSVVASYAGKIANKIINEVQKIKVIQDSKQKQFFNQSLNKYINNKEYRNEIKKIILEADLDIDDIIIKKEQLYTVHKKQGTKKTTLFNFSKESSGTQQLFALSSPFIEAFKSSSILLIDELDNSLHPLICQFIIKLFNSNKNNSKLIFTTHDVSLLDKNILHRDQIWFTQKDKFSSTNIFSLANLGERQNLNFAKRYLEGRYGALPYIKQLENIE